MLSKVAERIYWSARYIERIENTARLISIYDKLMYDLPHHIQISWYNLITINSLEAAFEERFTVKDERNVIKFMIDDKSNYSSIISSLNAVRENIRTTRDVVPEATWEMVNELTLYVNDNLNLGVSRRKRHEFLDDIVKGCQQIQGLLYANMPQDAAWDFLALGRTLERADMTSRILDAGMAEIMTFEEGSEALINAQQIIWGNVLRSVNADQAYRRTQRAAVHGNLVARYLLFSQQYPKAINFCLDVLIDSTANLPNNNTVLSLLVNMKTALNKDHDILLGEELRDFLNELQIQLGDLHDAISETWFPKW